MNSLQKKILSLLTSTALLSNAFFTVSAELPDDSETCVPVEQNEQTELTTESVQTELTEQTAEAVQTEQTEQAAEAVQTEQTEQTAEPIQTEQIKELDYYEAFKNWSIAEVDDFASKTRTGTVKINAFDEETGKTEEKETDFLDIKIDNPQSSSAIDNNGKKSRLFANIGKLNADKYYKISYIIQSDKDGEIFTRICDANGDNDIWYNNAGMNVTIRTDADINRTQEYNFISFDESIVPIEITKDIQYKFTSYFKSEKDIEDAVWEFQFGGSDIFMNSFPQKTTLRFMEIVITEVDESEAVYSNIYSKLISKDSETAENVQNMINANYSDYSRKLTPITEEGNLSRWNLIEGGSASLSKDFSKLYEDDIDYTGNSEDGTFNYVNIKLDNSGGTANGGLDRCDCGLTTDIGSIKENTIYSISYFIRSDHDGELYSKLYDKNTGTEFWHNNTGACRIQITEKNSDDDKEMSALDYEYIVYNESYKPIKIEANKEYIITVFYKATKDIENAAWEFQFGGAGKYQQKDCFPADTTLTFGELNFTKIDLDANELLLTTFFMEIKDYILKVGLYTYLTGITLPKIPVTRPDRTIEIEYIENGVLIKEIVTESSLKIGDLNFDGSTDLTDLTILSVSIMGGHLLSAKTLSIIGDLDGNGEADIADLARFRQYVCHDPNVPELVKSKKSV